MAISTPIPMTSYVYTFSMILIGFITWRSTKNFDDCILGGRSLDPFVAALFTGASDMSGQLLTGLPGAIFPLGISESWITIGLILDAWINRKLMAGRLRVHTEYNNNALMLPDYFTDRFEDKNRTSRIISALIILLFFAIYCASGIVAGACLFKNTFGMNYETALWTGAVATIIYTFIGGFLATSWTDITQASLMIFALILTSVMTIIGVGGFEDSLEVIKQKSIENVDMSKGLNFVATISLMGWGLDYFGQPHTLARFMAASSHHNIVHARRVSMTWMIPCLAGAVTVGSFGIAYFNNNPQPASTVNQNVGRVSIELAQIPFNLWIAGILLSAIFAAVMSALSRQLLVCSNTVTEDLYKAFLYKSANQKELVWVGHIMMLVMASVSITLVANPGNCVLGLVSYARAGFGVTLDPVVPFSVMWSRTTRNDALTGMTIGTMTVIVWKQFVWSGPYEITPGFVFSSTDIMVFSLLDKVPSAAMQRRFAKADTYYYSAPPSHSQAE